MRFFVGKLMQIECTWEICVQLCKYVYSSVQFIIDTIFPLKALNSRNLCRKYTSVRANIFVESKQIRRNFRSLKYFELLAKMLCWRRLFVIGRSCKPFKHIFITKWGYISTEENLLIIRDIHNNAYWKNGSVRLFLLWTKWRHT